MTAAVALILLHIYFANRFSQCHIHLKSMYAGLCVIGIGFAPLSLLAHDKPHWFEPGSGSISVFMSLQVLIATFGIRWCEQNWGDRNVCS